MKAVMLAFKKEGQGSCGQAREILNACGAKVVDSGEDKVNGRPCFAAVVDFDGRVGTLGRIQDLLESEGNKCGLDIKVLRPCLFLYMHRVVPVSHEPIT